MQRIKWGVIGGTVGGMAFGMWMMLYYWAFGLGFWSPLGYVGHFLLRNTADITAPAQVVVGLITHTMMSMMLGAALAVLLPPTARLVAMMRGVGVALVVWVAMQYVVLNFPDKVAFEDLVPWVFAVGHAVYGAMLGLLAGAASGLGARGVARAG